jgi:hypothetical protein
MLSMIFTHFAGELRFNYSVVTHYFQSKHGERHNNTPAGDLLIPSPKPGVAERPNRGSGSGSGSGSNKAGKRSIPIPIPIPTPEKSAPWRFIYSVVTHYFQSKHGERHNNTPAGDLLIPSPKPGVAERPNRGSGSGSVSGSNKAGKIDSDSDSDSDSDAGKIGAVKI